MINICIPVLNNYTGLITEINSLEAGTLKPDMYFVIDNGNRINNYSLPNLGSRLFIQSPGFNVGVAASWNWFIDNAKEIRLICNDDLIFFPNTLECLVNNYDENCIVTPMLANTFSCYMISDKIVKLVGRFDEKISPNYGYFEDNDYYYRTHLLGIEFKQAVNCNIEHSKSSTLKQFQGLEVQEHHRKFNRARSNYVLKWGGEPGNEKYTTPFIGN